MRFQTFSAGRFLDVCRKLGRGREVLNGTTSLQKSFCFLEDLNLPGIGLHTFSFRYLIVNLCKKKAINQTNKQTNQTNQPNKQTNQPNKPTKQTNKPNKQTNQTNQPNKQTNKPQKITDLREENKTQMASPEVNGDGSKGCQEETLLHLFTGSSPGWPRVELHRGVLRVYMCLYYTCWLNMMGLLFL